MNVKKQRKTRGYNLEEIGNYVSYLNQNIRGAFATQGKLTLPKNGDTEDINCASIDNIAGFPDGYAIDIVPKKPNERYYLDFILYVPGKKEDKFEPNGQGPERVKVKFGNDIRKAIYNIFMSEEGIEDLTLNPLKFKKERWFDIGAKANVLNARIEKLKKRYEENENRLWLYYTTNLNEKPAFVVHIPQDPYGAVSLLESWIENILNLGRRLPNK